MVRFALCAIATLLSLVSLPVAAQDLIGFDRSSFGNVVLSRNQAAGAGDITLELAIGDYNNESIRNYSADSIFARMGQSVGRLDILTDAGVFPCTAFIVDENHLLTNHHCVPGILDNESARATRIEAVQFVTGYVQQGVTQNTRTFQVLPVPVETSVDLDYSVLRVLGNPAADYGQLALAGGAPRDGDPFWVIGHPMGEAQRISREQCRANAPALSNRRLLHTCDTLPGNSGSPVIDAGLQQVIGLHHAGSKRDSVNFAIPMQDILAQSRILAAAGGVRPSPITSGGVPPVDSVTEASQCDMLYDEAKTWDACFAWQAYADKCGNHTYGGLARGYLAANCSATTPPVTSPVTQPVPDPTGPLRPWCTASRLNATEAAICENPYLAQLDADLTSAYNASSRDATAQGRWRTGTRDACGSNVACIARAVEARIAVLKTPAPVTGSRGLTLPAGQCYVTVASRTSVGEATAFIRSRVSGFDDVRMFEATNGYFAVTVATAYRSNADAQIALWKTQGRIPGDSYCSQGDRFVREIAWAEGGHGGGTSGGLLWVDNQRDGYLNLRRGPGTGHGIVQRMAPGTQLSQRAVNGNWVQVRLPDGVTGWAYRPFLTASAPRVTSCIGTVVNVGPRSTYNTARGNGFLAVRDAPSSRTGTLVSELYLGDRVSVIEQSGGWARLVCLSGACLSPYRGDSKVVGWSAAKFLSLSCP